MTLCIALIALLLVLGILEGVIHRRNVDKVPIRILVNGTRGKTTTARLIVASLNAAGIRTLGRTTGSEAQYIYPDGTVETFARKRKASILEMKSIFRKASALGVQCVVVECMALRPENQRAMADTLVRPTHVVMTNTFLDHIAEMGGSIEQTAYAMGLSVPKGCNLYVTEPYYDHLDVKLHKVEEEPVPVVSSIPIHASNYALTKALMEDLGCSVSAIAEGAQTIVSDIGLHKQMLCHGGALFVPTFSVNDLTCMDQTVKDTVMSNTGKAIWLVFNNRADREYRILLMDQVLERNRDSICGIYCIGDYPWKVSRHFSRRGFDSRPIDVNGLADEMNRSDPDCVFVGLGNIKGCGEMLLNRILEEGN